MNKNTTAPQLFTLCAGFVALLFITNRRHWLGLDLTSEEMGALFTGLGFAGLVATFWHQREERTSRDSQHADLITKMVSQIQATNQQRIALARSAYVSAVIGSFGAAGSQPVNALQEKLRGKLEDALNLLEKDGYIYLN